jgi:hypothetical protein
MIASICPVTDKTAPGRENKEAEEEEVLLLSSGYDS